jgi:hypothetical protein
MTSPRNEARRCPDYTAFLEGQLAEECDARRNAGYERLWFEMNRDSLELLRQRVIEQSRAALALLKPSERP